MIPQPTSINSTASKSSSDDADVDDNGFCPSVAAVGERSSCYHKINSISKKDHITLCHGVYETPGVVRSTLSPPQTRAFA